MKETNKDSLLLTIFGHAFRQYVDNPTVHSRDVRPLERAYIQDNLYIGVNIRM
jgi:hypothetical protein